MSARDRQPNDDTDLIIGPTVPIPFKRRPAPPALIELQHGPTAAGFSSRLGDITGSGLNLAAAPTGWLSLGTTS